MLSGGRRRRALGTSIAADDSMMVTNLELETEIGDQMEDSVLNSMWVKVFSSGLTVSVA